MKKDNTRKQSRREKRRKKKEMRDNLKNTNTTEKFVVSGP
jgi:hypothetical protein